MAVVADSYGKTTARHHVIGEGADALEMDILDEVYGWAAKNSLRLFDIRIQAMRSKDPKGAAAEYICDCVEAWNLTSGGVPVPLDVEVLKLWSMDRLAKIALLVYERQKNSRSPLSVDDAEEDAKKLLECLLKARAQELLNETANLPGDDHRRQVARQAGRRAGLINGITIKELNAAVHSLDAMLNE
ncbi:MAG TPA: hypothetical protein VJX74_16155 [Blastocatellia bacterium]|nr:hypothetical protein [Blastocatellia bacterium]